MKSRTWKISIFILLFSICMCAFVSMDLNQNKVYAANAEMLGCYNLITSDDEIYESNLEVGTISGTGKYSVGSPNTVLTATANENYHIVGWQVTYDEQSGNKEFFDTTDLVGLTKTIELTQKDPTKEKISATLKFTSSNGYLVSGTFQISYIFEDLTVAPVFDHIYYKVNLENVVDVADLTEDVVDGNVLYYKEKIDGAVTCYTNAIINIGDVNYYYGNLYKKDGKFYTLHLKQDDSNTEEIVEYTKGAFRFGEEVNISYDIKIDNADIINSKNIDLKGVSLTANSTIELALYDEDDPQSSYYYEFTKDVYLRTTSFKVKFNVEKNNNFVNNVNLNYHALYLVDINVFVDGSPAGANKDEVLGTQTMSEPDFISNVSVSNFYSCIDQDNLLFFAKQAQHNSSRAFGVTCVESVTNVVDDNTYIYYTFDSLNGQNDRYSDYANLNTNLEIHVNFNTFKYNVSFESLEYVGDGLPLTPLNGNTLEPVSLKRGEEIALDETSVQTVFNSGYEFFGFTTQDQDEIVDEISYNVNMTAPEGTMIYLCYKKKDFGVEVRGLNTQPKIGDNYAIDKILFSITTLDPVTEERSSGDVVSNTLSLTNTLKLGSLISLSPTINNGFDVKFSLNQNPTQDDYINSFDVDYNFVQNNLESFGLYQYSPTNWLRDYSKLYIWENGEYVINTSEIHVARDYFVRTNADTIVIYANETTFTYTLTYIINPAEDNKLKADVIMATISANVPDSVKDSVKKYAVEKDDGELIYTEICDANNNLSERVAKIVIPGLRYSDQVELLSEGITEDGEGNPYSYIFNWFTRDGNSKLSSDVDGNVHSYTETITKDRTITVSYSMPRTQIKFLVDEEFAENPNFIFDISVLNKNKNDEILEPDNDGLYSVDVGDVLEVTIYNLSEGYSFIGYSVEGSNEVKDENLVFDYESVSGNNFLTLKFKRNQYRFDFYEYGGGRNGYTFSEEFNIDNTSFIIVKPVGYYVATVRFKVGNNYVDTFSSLLSENNDYRMNEDIITYTFDPSREQFIQIVNNYGRVIDVNGEDVNVVDVVIDYLSFTYNISVIYDITNKKATSPMSSVQFPAVEMTYDFKGESFSIIKSYQSLTVVFTDVRYGSEDARISVLSGTPLGLEFAGWFVGEQMISQANYIHASDYIELGRIVKDLQFYYKLSYISYYVNVNYDSRQGNPEVFVNNVLQSGTTNIQVTLDDTLKINAMASKASGYKFSAITYKKPKFTPYVYVDETKWNDEWEMLYIKNGNSYVKNLSSTYDPDSEYCWYEYDIVRYADSDTFSKRFNVVDYFMEGVYAYITVEYELMQFTLNHSISNIITSYGVEIERGNLVGGTNDGRFEFPVSDLISFRVFAKDLKGVQREIVANDTVTFKDEIIVYAQINQQAINIADQKEYDLTLGVNLQEVYLNGSVISGWKETSQGLYLITFNIEQFRPTEETVSVKYDLAMEMREISVTAIVTESVDFYRNINMVINASSYGFAAGPATYNPSKDSVEPKKVLKAGRLSFMAKAKAFSQLSSEYQDYFFISGVIIYCDGVEIDKSEYAQYGIEVNEADWSVISKLLNNVHIVYKIQPKITYNGGPNFELVFDCDNEGNPKAQRLTIGGASSNIVMASMFIDNEVVKVHYVSTGVNGIPSDSVTTCGKYNVVLSFEKVEGYEWVEEIKIEDKLTLTVKPKPVVLIYDEIAANNNKLEKTYDGASGFDVNNIYNYLIFTDGAGWSIRYSDLLTKGGNVLKLDQSISAYITSNGKDERTSLANEDVYYNIYVYNIALRPIDYNNNFVLNTQDLIIKEHIKINKRKLGLSGVKIYNKVYDETADAELMSFGDSVILNKISGDDVVIDIEKLVVQFEDAEVGTNKKVIVFASTALGGEDMGNYYINDIEVEGLTIYPYSISYDVKGFGKVSLINECGLTDKDKVDLIPLNAVFEVSPIYVDTKQYTSIHSKISKYLKGNNEYAIGYELLMYVNGEEIEINKDLNLSIPKVKNSTGLYFLTGSQTGSVKYDTSGKYFVISLNQLNVDVDAFFITQKKILLEVWQIVLIVIMSALTIAAVVLTIVIVRKRKLKEYKVHDKI